MQKNQKIWISVAAAAAFSFAISCSDPPPAPSTVEAAGDVAAGSASDRQERGATIPFAKLKLFLEFNSTDDDLGVQLLLDAGDWVRVRVAIRVGGSSSKSNPVGVSANSESRSVLRERGAFS